MIEPPPLRQWRYLVALAETKHFTRAADACAVTQSTFSAGIRELENRLQAVLVDRTKRRTVLTPLGLALAARARELLSMADDMVRLAQSTSEPLTGPLNLGVIPTISPFLLPRLLPGLRRKYPKLKLFLREDLTARLLEDMAAGKLDLALIALPYEADGIETMPLFSDPFRFACRKDHPLAGKDKIAPAALDPDQLLLLEDGHCLREHALAACKLAPPRRHGNLASHAGAGLGGTSLHTLVQMVDNGLGVTLLPKLAIDAGILRGTQVIYRPLAPERGQPEGVARKIGLAWRRGTQRADEFRLLGEALLQLHRKDAERKEAI